MTSPKDSYGTNYTASPAPLYTRIIPVFRTLRGNVMSKT